MRGGSIAEFGASLIIASLTALSTLGGLALAAYACFALHPGMKVLGLILLLFSVVDLRIFVMLSRQAAEEMAMWADSLLPKESSASLKRMT
jgi:hypothetical protein